MPGDQYERLPIETEGDLVTVRKAARDAATALGFGLTDVTRIVTAVSELARNIHRFAGEGEVTWRPVDEGGKRDDGGDDKVLGCAEFGHGG